MAWWPVERWEALRLALGARGALPREVGTLILPQGCPLVPWRLPPLHPLAQFARDWQTSDALRRENAEVWLFESSKGKFEARRLLTSPRSCGERSTRIVRCASGEGPGTAL
jgi:hypothetical protein